MINWRSNTTIAAALFLFFLIYATLAVFMNRGFILTIGVGLVLWLIVGAIGFGFDYRARRRPGRIGQGATPPERVPELDVVFEDDALEPEAAVAPAGSVDFVVLNEGRQRHDFVLVRADNGSSPVRGGHLLQAGGVPVVGHIGELAPGESMHATFTLQPGRYLMSCREAGHAPLGGGVDLTVQPVDEAA